MMRVLLCAVSFSGLQTAAASKVETHIKVFGDSWMIDETVGGRLKTGWSHVLAKKMDAEIGPPIAGFGWKSDQLAKKVRAMKFDKWLSGSLALVHVGGNDIQPLIVAVWFASWTDAAQRQKIRSWIQPVVDNTVSLVQHLCAKPFKRIMVSEPPFSKHLPIIKQAVTSKNLRQLKEETSWAYKVAFVDNAASWKKKGCTVEIFKEGQLLDALGDKEDLKSYVDGLHPKFEIHKRLGELAYQMLTAQKLTVGKKGNRKPLDEL